MTVRHFFKAFVFGTAGIALFLGAAIVLARLEAPSWIENKIVTSIKDSCPRCEIKMSAVELSIFDGRVSFLDFYYEDDPSHHSRVSVHARRLEVQASLKSFIVKPIIVENLRGDEVSFTLTENPAIDSEHSDKSPPLSGLPPLVFEHIEVHQSSFHYVDLVKPHLSSLLLTQVHGTVGAWSTRREIANQYTPDPTEIRATGVLEDSGHFVVEASADPLSPRGTAQIHIAVKDQPLEKVSDFFLHEEGIELKGRIFEISTDLKMTNGKIDGKLKATYYALGVKVVDPKSSGLKNFLVTAGVDLVKKNEQGINGKPPGEKSVTGERGPEQGLIGAIFHALGAAAKELMRG
jgi:hypothetical protein